MAEQPTGTVTLLFTDIEGSTRLLEQLGADRYGEALEVHRRSLRRAFSQHGGYEVDCEGDAFFIAFDRAQQALSAAAAAQDALSAVEWPDGLEWRVRMGIHTGEPLVAPPKYVGLDVHKAARIMAAGHGGQVLVSLATRDLTSGSDLLDLGAYRLKDLAEPERLFQLGQAEFPPLRSLNRTNLPLATGPLLGRETELVRIEKLLAGGSRLVTLTGPGGSGKTRLALQAAAELVDEFADGVFFVALAPLGDAGAVTAAVAQALGLRANDDLHAYLDSRRLLLILDNAEHLAGVEHVVKDLICGDVIVLVTSRSPLHLSAELELAVEPLADEAAAELFSLRAAAVGRSVVPDAMIVELCRRLDNLPLAVELAAARAKLLAPSAILERLERALPFLTGGPRDAPERQQTLRATIEWSHESLSETERAALRRLAVFCGTFSLEAADTVAGADFDTVAALVDKSLLKPIVEQRFLMLETLREFALEQLEAAGETHQTALRHAEYFCDVAEAAAVELDNLGATSLKWLQRLDIEVFDVRVALGYLEKRGDYDREARAIVALWHYWTLRDYREARAWFERAATVSGEGATRAKALSALATVWMRQGESERASEVASEALQLYREVGDGVGERRALLVLGGLMGSLGSFDAARAYIAEALPMIEAADDRRSLGGVLTQLSYLALFQGQYAEAAARAREAADLHAELGRPLQRATDLVNLASATIGLDRPHDAVAPLLEAVRVAAELGDKQTIAYSLDGLAAAGAVLGRSQEAALLLGAADEFHQATGAAREPYERGVDDRTRAALTTLLADDLAAGIAAGRALTVDEVVAHALEAETWA